MTDNNDIELTLKDIASYLMLPLEEAAHSHKDCEHRQVMLDDQAHTVTCKSCGKQVDPFWYLCLLAREWKHRAYQDQSAKEAWERLQRRDKEDRCKGRIFVRPPQPCPAQEAWDTYVAYYNRDPYAVYYSYKEWRAAADECSSESISFLRKLIADRLKDKR